MLALFRIVLVLTVCAASQAVAHGARAPVEHPGGIPIAHLEHGQMAVLARHRGDILDLAARHYPPDDTLRRLTNYASIQFSYCLWGLMPGTVTDEASPFNTCAHAYLAATREALLRLTTLPGRSPQVEALRARIDEDMTAHASDLYLCQYSADTYTTAQIVRPDWRAITGHLPSLLVVLSVLIATGAVLRGLRRPSRT
ncbi:MAG TPA: hypothetical protein VGC40_01545 [Paenirhodobacter sp.]